MPNIKSAKKRVKVAAAKTAQNKVLTSAMRTEIKKANAAIERSRRSTRQLLRASSRRIPLPERNHHWLASSMQVFKTEK